MDDEKAIINHSFKNFRMEEGRNESFKETKYQGKATKKLIDVYLQAEGKEDPVEKMLKMYR